MAEKETGGQSSGNQGIPERRKEEVASEAELKERTMDKTLADSFPASDPPSSIPDPSEDEDESPAAA